MLWHSHAPQEQPERAGGVPRARSPIPRLGWRAGGRRRPVTLLGALHSPGGSKGDGSAPGWREPPLEVQPMPRNPLQSN